jgi:hypothetical protein
MAVVEGWLTFELWGASRAAAKRPNERFVRPIIFCYYGRHYGSPAELLCDMDGWGITAKKASA